MWSLTVLRLAILSILIFTCSLTAPSRGRSESGALKREIKLKAGQTVLVKEAGLKITFERVLEDSRCPQGVTCVWAGNGKVALKISPVRKAQSSVQLNTTLDPKEQSFLGYDIKLVRLDPYPQANAKIDPRSYVLTLLVTRKQPG